ncbi:hypothetical protein X997_5527 [Burkholderia pseudomallei A79C]|nr:hypothetical protein X997_5527 [Burkholderia pseudomallei A79C]
MGCFAHACLVSMNRNCERYGNEWLRVKLGRL